MPVDESAPADPRNVYAATKLHQEHLCGLWGRAAGATAVALRYHNVYGPRMPRDTPYAGVASIFRSALAGGRPALVFEDGGQTRDFVHVRDVARANVLALTADVVPGAYNIASGSPHTVLDMADRPDRRLRPRRSPPRDPGRLAPRRRPPHRGLAPQGGRGTRASPPRSASRTGWPSSPGPRNGPPPTRHDRRSKTGRPAGP